MLALFLSLLFTLLIGRFYQLQIVEGEHWTQIALEQHQMIVKEPFIRGSFYSNTSIKLGHPEEEQPFVVDVPKFHLFVDPASIPPEARGRWIEGIAHAFPQLSVDKLQKELGKKSRSRKLATWLDRDARTQIEAWWRPFAKEEKLPLNALFFTFEYKRSYPFGPLLGSVLHTVQEERDPKTGQPIPTGGLELFFHTYLQGKEGKKKWLRSPHHPLDRGKVIEPPEHGADIYLTINHYLQAIAEAELQKGVRAARAKGGWAVMMDPYTGEILALAQVPCLDPTHYADFFNDPRLSDATRVTAVSDCFEPGSIFKPLMLTLCLQANEELAKEGKPPLFSPNERIATSNGWFPGRSTPIKDGRSHAYLNMDLALQKSSNVYMGKVTQRLIERMGDRWVRERLQTLFGFGQKTGVELPGESGGLLPTPGKLHPNGRPEWSLSTPYSLAMGHNILVNSLQIAKAYALFANGGLAVEPHLVRKIVKGQPDGSRKILVDRTSWRASKRVLSPSVVQAIVRGLKFVTKEGGTSKRADIAGYTEAGKSGTSEKIVAGSYSDQHYISSFVGFAPASRPRFVLLVSVDEPEVGWIPSVGKQHHGGIAAAPIFREIATRSLQYLGVAPDDPHGYPPGDPRRDVSRADWVKEVEALKQLYEEWNGR